MRDRAEASDIRKFKHIALVTGDADKLALYYDRFGTMIRQDEVPRRARAAFITDA